MLEIVVPLNNLPAASAAQLCIGLLRGANKLGSILKLYGVSTEIAAIDRQLRGRNAFHIEGSEFETHLASVQNHGLSFLTVDGIESGNEVAWVNAVSAVAPLISARVYDADYEHWQNAEDPLVYEAAGRSIDGLLMRSNGLPPPLDQLVIDISGNPGRRILRAGYVEAVGHQMWLGEEFFRRVSGANRATILSTPWLVTSEGPEAVVEVNGHSRLFRDDVSADLQERLRSTLFPAAS